jgi:hypothetical protein
MLTKSSHLKHCPNVLKHATFLLLSMNFSWGDVVKSLRVKTLNFFCWRLICHTWNVVCWCPFLAASYNFSKRVYIQVGAIKCCCSLLHIYVKYVDSFLTSNWCGWVVLFCFVFLGMLHMMHGIYNVKIVSDLILGHEWS